MNPTKLIPKGKKSSDINMGVLKDYNYKIEVHKLWKRFIRENLDVPRKQMSVLCLPGYYGREVENVYYKLGIPSENIIGIEEDREAYDNLRKTHNFHVANMDILDYVKRTNKKFHIVSLDFTGYLTDKERELLRIIGKRGLLEDNSVLLTNFSGRRESKEQQQKYQKRIALTELNSRLRDSITSPNVLGNYEDPLANVELPDQLVDISQKDLENLVKGGVINDLGLAIKRTEKGLVITAPGLIDEASKEDLTKMIESGAMITDSNGTTLFKMNTDKEKMRDVGIPQEVFYSLVDYSYEHMRNSNMVRGFLDFYEPKLLEETIKERSFLSANREMLDSTFPIKNPTSDRDKINVSEEEKIRFIKKYGDNAIFQRMIEWLCFRSFKWHPHVTHLVRLYESGILVPQKIELYRYISDDGSPMNCDFWSLENIKKIIPQVKRYADNFYKFPLGWAVLEEVDKHVRTSKRGPRDMIEFLETVNRGQNPAYELPNSPILEITWEHAKRFERLSHKIGSQLNLLEAGGNDRVFFGSFYKPKAKYKEVARMLLLEKTDEEIYDKYRIEKMELAGVKAALKRGSYEDLKIELEKGVKEQKPDRLEKKVETIITEKKNHDKYLLIPHKEYKNLSEKNIISENQKLRMRYFRQEIQNLEENRKKTLYESLIQSGWFNALERGVSDMKVYAFFDDLMLNFVHRKGRINVKKIRSLWDCVQNSDRLYEVTHVYKTKPQSLGKHTKKKGLLEKQNREIYDYIGAGFSNEDIASEFGLKPRQIAARRAWYKIRGNAEKPEVKEGTNSMICEDIILGVSDEQIMDKYNIPKTKLAGQKMMLTKRGVKWKK